VVIQLAGVNDAPVITPGAAQGAAGSPITGTVSADDVDGDALAFALAVAPAHGTVAIDPATGAYIYTAAAGFTGEDSFLVRVTDTAGASADAAMVVTVVPSDNLPPVLTPAAGAVTEDGGIIAGTLVASDPDGEGALSFALVAPVAGLQVAADGSWTFDASHAAYQVLAAGQTQVVQAHWSATDAGGASAQSTIEIVVTGANDAPTLLAPLVDQQWTGGTPGAFTIPAGSFGDPDGDALTWTAQLEDGSTLPSWLTFDPATRTLTGTPPGAGTALSLRITASDGVLTRDDIFALTVTPASGGGEIPWPDTTNVVAFHPEEMTGTAANDHIFATSASNGNALSGLGGDDRMISESWNSTMSGGDGADVLEARNSDQTVTGGAGIDHFVFDVGNFVGESWGLDPQYLWATITDFEDGIDRIAILNTVADLSDVTFTQDGADTWISFAGGPKIVVANTSAAALSGDDLIVRLGGDAGVPPAGGGVAYPGTTNVVAYDAAVMGGTAANDLVHALSAENGGWNGTALLGRDGDDRLITESWASFASGGAGNDVIEIRNDNVVAIGGAGYDYFVFRTDDFVGEGWAMDPEFVWATITGFTSGEDKVVIAGAAYGDLDIDQVGDNVEIAWAGAPRVILSGTSVADIDASDFIFETAPLQARAHAGWNPFAHDVDGHARNRDYNPEYAEAVQPEMLTWFA
jgi:VCBS repeat-containing protein